MSVTKRNRIIEGKKKSFYQAEVWIAGQRVVSKSFPTKAAAHLWHEQERSRLLGGPKIMPFREVIDLYRRQHLPTVSPETARTMERKLVYVESSPLAGLTMDAVDDKAVDRWMDWLWEHPTKDTPWRRSFKNEVVQLSMLLKWWHDHHDPKFSNPVIKRHHKRAVFKHIEKRRPDYFVRVEDIAPWLEQLRQVTEPVYWRLAAFQVLTGCRIGEVMGLCWDAVDLERRQARIFRTASWDEAQKVTVVKDQVKTTGSNRVVGLPTELIAILEGVEHRTGPVFRLQDGRLPKYALVKHYYSQAFKRLGLPWRATHIMRHSWATLGLQANAGNLGAIQAALGHTTPTMTMKYAKVVALMSNSTGDRVSALIHRHVQPAYSGPAAAESSVREIS